MERDPATSGMDFPHQNTLKRVQEVLRSVGSYGVLALALLEISKLAFSETSRREILRRDGYQCTVCGSSNHLEAAHYDHSRRNPDYDNPNNGRTLCTEHHLEDHKKRRHNGLSRQDNDWAIVELEKRLTWQQLEDTEARVG